MSDGWCERCGKRPSLRDMSGLPYAYICLECSPSPGLLKARCELLEARCERYRNALIDIASEDDEGHSISDQREQDKRWASIALEENPT